MSGERSRWLHGQQPAKLAAAYLGRPKGRGEETGCDRAQERLRCGAERGHRRACCPGTLGKNPSEPVAIIATESYIVVASRLFAERKIALAREIIESEATVISREIGHVGPADSWRTSQGEIAAREGRRMRCAIDYLPPGMLPIANRERLFAMAIGTLLYSE
ncbi:hypothetical protein Acel_1622 [Acidothermus cellulolyticus 11B]|uniref:Uncharacterized protein n=1 Tax=Acidothermus cellulolyticus (strain ATCC 43068 / DSM 8971 / 11B) TaxID=351607 RepID=A0LVD4_ACIC1|nr:hypothetical protein Acel_1622 [Acidothermus cellulolyticus 11B]